MVKGQTFSFVRCDKSTKTRNIRRIEKNIPEHIINNIQVIWSISSMEILEEKKIAEFGATKPAYGYMNAWIDFYTVFENNTCSEEWLYILKYRYAMPRIIQRAHSEAEKSYLSGKKWHRLIYLRQYCCYIISCSIFIFHPKAI